MRLDRFLTLAVVRPLRRVLPLGKAPRLPILMYHSISDDPESGVSPYYRTATSPQIFAGHMALLAAGGWRGVSLADGMKSLNGGWHSRDVAITFDDGFRDFYQNAAPALRQRAFSATMFLPTAFISDERRQFKGRDCMNWAEVRELQAEGIEFGSHTVNHPKLYELDFASIRTELVDSKAVLDRELGKNISSFAYPFAFPGADRSFVNTFVNLLKSSGYRHCVTTEIGRVAPADDAYTLKRLPANSADDAALLSAKLDGEYDWMRFPQSSFKKCKSVLRRRPNGLNPRGNSNSN